MSHLELIYRFSDVIKQHLPLLSKSQASGLAAWTIGTAVGGSASLSSVSQSIALMLVQALESTRKRLREWYLEADAKSGSHRSSFDVELQFPYLLVWLLSLLPGNRVALALDATNLRDRFIVLCVSVLLDRHAIPVAWRVLRSNQKGEWNAIWEHLLDCLASVLTGKDVWVFTDRGIESSRIFKAITAHHWHPMMRVKIEAHFRPEGKDWLPIGMLADALDQAQYGHLYKTNPIECCLIVFRGKQAQEPWILMTDLSRANAQWYAMRFWIENQFKKIKSRGCHWERTKIENSERMTKLWLVYAMTLLWAVISGSNQESSQPKLARSTKKASRTISLFARGIAFMSASIMKGIMPLLVPVSHYKWADELYNST